MQEREFQNMFTFCPGFEAAMLKTPPPPPPPAPAEDLSQKKQLRIGFAKFRTRLAALEARNVLNGRKVDLQTGAVLRAELAKKNLQMKRINTFNSGYDMSHSVSSNGPSSASAISGAGAAGPMSAPAITAPRNPIPADQNPPCNTLYVGNLPVNAQEDELRRIFSRMRGYKRLCFRPKPGTGPMCFVEFDDVPCATHAMNELYGTPLSNSVKGGIRLSYSKNPLGVRQNTGNAQQ
ncbi:hypothetical protein THASP1DRAFT_7899, partial [Thamnocephalis sphaerospora]